MVRVVWGILLFFGPVLFTGADPRYTVESSLFIPQSYYVGDRVELRVVLKTFGGLQAVPPRELPKLPWGELHEIRLNSAEARLEVRLVFTPFQPGTQTFPSLRLGDLAIEGLKVYVRSLVDEGRTDLAPPRGQLLLPSTKLIVGLVVGGFLALPLIGTFLLLWVRPRLRVLYARYQERRPYKRLQKFLHTLREQIQEIDGRRYYISLLEQMKIYLSHRGGGNCMAFTTREMEDYLFRSFDRREENERLLKIFVFGDEVKFGGRRASPEKKMEDLLAAVEISSLLEKEKKERAHARL